MNIALLVKQVPNTDKITIDREHGTLQRKGIESILNPYCEYGLDLAVGMKKKYKNVKITAFTMGPPSAELALRRAIALGVDNGVLLSDGKFSGADCWATAYTLSVGIRSVMGIPDIIIAGKQAIDGDTAQVPAELSEFMRMPILPYTNEVISIDKDIIAKCEFDNELVTLRSPLPVVITVGNGSNLKRIPSIEDAIKAYKSKIRIIDKNNAIFDVDKIGLKGSPTRVVDIRPIVSSGSCLIFDENNFEKGVKVFWNYLKKLNT